MKKLEEFPPEIGRRVGQGIDWDTVLDGGVYQLTEGEDFTCKITTLQVTVHKEAKKRNVKVRTAKLLDGSGLVVQKTVARTPSR